MKREVNKMKKAQQLLKDIKNTNVSYAIMDEDNEIYCNKETNNIMDIYGYDNENGHFYGVYSDVVDGQLDSRYFCDEQIYLRTLISNAHSFLKNKKTIYFL